MYKSILCRSAVIVSPSDDSAEYAGFLEQTDHIRPLDHEENQSFDHVTAHDELLD
jgi:hypothetical protein